MQEEAEAGCCTHCDIGRQHDKEVLVDHQVQDFSVSKDGAFGPIVSCCYPCEDEAHGDPEESEEAMERGMGSRRILAVEGCKLLSEDQVPWFVVDFLVAQELLGFLPNAGLQHILKDWVFGGENILPFLA